MSGIECFMAGLEELGLKCRQQGNLVVVTLDVSPLGIPGPHEAGADPPKDFPSVPPHWLHLRKELVLPEGNSKPSELGEDWRKWSRKHPKWRNDDNAARLWVAHARSLLLLAKAA